MRTINSENSIANVLFGQVRCGIFALLFTHCDESYYVRQIARATGSGLGAVHRELNNLVQAGLVTRTSSGRQVYYRANSSSPVFNELRGLIVKTVGIADVLRGALAPLADQITAAFIYGSFAKGSEMAESDVDVMIIGDVGLAEVVSALNRSEDRLSREINPSVFPPAEFERRARDEEHFVAAVLREPKIMLIGDQNELEGSGGTRQT